MSTLAGDLQLAQITFEDGDYARRTRKLLDLPRDQWLAGSPFGYTVWRYDDVIAVLRDKRWHSAASRIPQIFGITDERFLARQQVNILSAEGDVHTRLRRLVGQAFTPRAADRLRPFMHQVIDDLVDGVAAAGRAEFVADISDPYPIPIMCELLGAPKRDWQLFSRWAEDVLQVFSIDIASKLDLIIRTQDELAAYTRDLIDQRRASPADDLLTALIAAEAEGDRLTTDELVMMVNAVIVAGTDTTRNQLACAVALLAEHPDQWVLLAERPELASRAVEETMRIAGAVRGTVRFASTDIEYRDVRFPAGTIMSVGLGAANRDGEVFDHPDTFDITVEARDQPQLTFGSGIHYCLGAALARAELQEALPVLARRMPNLRLDGRPTWRPEGGAINGPSSLPITFDPGH